MAGDIGKEAQQPTLKDLLKETLLSVAKTEDRSKVDGWIEEGLPKLVEKEKEYLEARKAHENDRGEAALDDLRFINNTIGTLPNIRVGNYGSFKNPEVREYPNQLIMVDWERSDRPNNPSEVFRYIIHGQEIDEPLSVMGLLKAVRSGIKQARGY